MSGSVGRRRTRIGAGKAVAALLCAIGVATIAASAVMAAIAAVPQNTALPTITGSPQVGQTLTANDGSWSNAPTSFSYVWLRCNPQGRSCNQIGGATQKTYLLVAADQGKTVRVRVTATNADGSGAAESNQTATIAAGGATTGPKNTAPPTISGTAKVGQTLTATEGSWTGNPTAYGYQWQRCNVDAPTCVAVPTATAKTYAVRLADLGYRLRVAVTARNAKGAATATSAITAPVQPTTAITNRRPTIRIVSILFTGATVYARFRICDDSNKNLTIRETDSKPGVAPATRRFATLVAPRPCGVYTRRWLPAPRFRTGRYTITLRAVDKSGFVSLPARRTFTR